MRTNINHLRRSALRSAALLASGLLVTTQLFAQPPYNHRYPQSTGLSIQGPAGKSITHRGCHVVSANSILSPGGSSDFHLTITDPTGALFNSFHIGNPGTNEYCNAVCNSTLAPSAFFLCGRSDNDNMLVMRVNGAGTVSWSKEIVFAGAISEAVTIVPVYDPPKQGYIVVGNCGPEVAAVKLDENGNILWSHTYPMAASYISNVVTDALVHTSLDYERIMTITGNHNTATTKDIFRINLETFTGGPVGQNTIYSNTAGHVFANPQVTNVGSGVSWTDNRIIISFLQADSPLSSNYTDLNFLATDLPSSTIAWAFTFEKTGVTELYNQDICRLSTAKFSALVTEHTLPLHYNPAIINIDDAGNLNYSFSVNEGRIQFAHSLMDNCASGFEVLNGRDLNAMPSTDLQLIANASTPLDCRAPYSWSRTVTNLVQSPVTLNSVGSASTVNYPVTATSAGLADIYDCHDHLVYLKRGGEFTENEDYADSWVWPNPASTELTVSAGAATETVTILNNLGQPVLIQQVQDIAKLDIAHLPTGYYIIQYTGATGEVKQEKLVIQH